MLDNTKQYFADKYESVKESVTGRGARENAGRAAFLGGMVGGVVAGEATNEYLDSVDGGPENAALAAAKEATDAVPDTYRRLAVNALFVAAGGAAGRYAQEAIRPERVVEVDLPDREGELPKSEAQEIIRASRKKQLAETRRVGRSVLGDEVEVMDDPHAIIERVAEELNGRLQSSMNGEVSNPGLGDITSTDLPANVVSGIVEAMHETGEPEEALGGFLSEETRDSVLDTWAETYGEDEHVAA
jgi:hypothetical protein